MWRSVRRLAALAAVGVGGAVFGAPSALVAAIPASSTVTPAAARATSNDPGAPLQWGLDLINAPTAWQVSTGSGTTIAIIDSGADLDHDDLDERIASGVTCLDTGGFPNLCRAGGRDDGRDDNGHGTHVAGIAAATRDNGAGIAGVAPDASLLVIKALRQQCTGGTCKAIGSPLDITAAIRYAADAGATVINLSVGGTTQSLAGPGFADAVRYAWQKGSIPVVAAGNDAKTATGYADLNVVVVTAVDREGRRPTYANAIGDAKWALAAPGGSDTADTSETCESAPGGILSTYWIADVDDAYACLPGTSAAAAFVAGGLAVLRASGLGQEASVLRLLSTATAGPDPSYGAGRLDLARAVSASTDPTTTTAVPGTVPPVTDPTDPPAAEDEPAIDDPTTTVAPDVPADPPVVEAPVEVDPTLPERAEVALGSGAGSDDDLPGGPVALAVLLSIAVGGASGWRLVRTADWARRTPMR